MASLKDVRTLAEELEQRVSRLNEEVARGSSDFLKVVVLADEVAELADTLASTFSAIDEQIEHRVSEASGDTGRRTQSQARRGAAKGQQQRGRAKRQPQRRGAKSQAKRGSARRSAASAPRGKTTEEPTKSELLEQAKEVGITGRSEMSKDDLAEAVKSQEQQTKEELLEQAQAASIPGRSEMSKRELLEALRKEASVTREELLERANEADIPGRSEMTKEELREALRSVLR